MKFMIEGYEVGYNASIEAALSQAADEVQADPELIIRVMIETVKAPCVHCGVSHGAQYACDPCP